MGYNYSFVISNTKSKYQSTLIASNGKDLIYISTKGLLVNQPLLIELLKTEIINSDSFVLEFFMQHLLSSDWLGSFMCLLRIVRSSAKLVPCIINS